MGFSIAGAGHVAAGMADMEGQLAQNKFRHQLNEQMASQVRQQQEREAFERMARRNIQAPQWNLGNLPQGQMQNQPAAAPAAPEQVSDRNENYGNEGRGKPPVVTGELEKLQAERAQYEQLLKGTQSNIAAFDTARAPRPAGPTVDDGYGGVYTPETGRKFLTSPQESQQYRDMQGQAAGYKQGIAQYDQLIAEQAKKQHKQTMAESPSSPGNDKIKAFVTQYGPAAEKVGAQIGVDPKILLAQWGHETGWGKSVIPGTNNLGNIKGKGPSAKDNMTGSVDTYRRYGSPDEFGADYASLIQRKYGGAVGAGSDVGKFTQGLSGYAEDPQYAAKIANSYRMVGGVLGTAAPQQQTAAAPQQGAPAQNLTGQATVMSGQNYDLGMQQLKQEYDYFATVMQNTFDSQQRLKILDQMQRLQQKGQEMQIERVGQAAQFNPEALQQLVSFMAGRVGQPIGVVTDGKGNAQLVRQDGQPIQGQWGQPMPTATLVDGILNNLIPSRAAANSADAAVRSKAMAESTGKAVGEGQIAHIQGQYGLAREQMQGLSMAVITQAKEAAHNGRWGQAVPDGMGGFIAARPDGTFVHSLAPVTDKSGKVSTPQPRVITFDQLNAGMIPRG